MPEVNIHHSEKDEPITVGDVIVAGEHVVWVVWHERVGMFYLVHAKTLEIVGEVSHLYNALPAVKNSYGECHLVKSKQVTVDIHKT